MTTTSNTNLTTETSAYNNPFLDDDVFPHFVALTGDPIDAVRLADDAQLLLEYVAACVTAQDTGSIAPAFPEFDSQFLQDIGAVARPWLQRCLDFAAKEADKAAITFQRLRTAATDRAKSTPSSALKTAAGRRAWAAFARAAKDVVL